MTDKVDSAQVSRNGVTLVRENEDLINRRLALQTAAGAGLSPPDILDTAKQYYDFLTTGEIDNASL